MANNTPVYMYVHVYMFIWILDTDSPEKVCILIIGTMFQIHNDEQ